jgi:Cof subfamily protein (haloacid dehalogenase superfamily)
MELSKVKLIVTDMDGTLLNSQHNISPLFFNLFKKLMHHNIIFVAASGRPYYGMIEKLEAIKDDIIVVAENGGLALKNDTVFISNPITPKHLQHIISIVENIDNAHPVFCTRHKAYVMSNSKPLLNLLSEFYNNYEVIEDPKAITEEVYKIALYHEDSSEKFIYPHIKQLETKFKVKLSATHWVDISEIEANKGEAIKHIQKTYDITPAETMAFGDYNNDLEMLENAYHSYAMANAHPLVKATARFETESNNNFGVEKILEKVVLEKEKLLS